MLIYCDIVSGDELFTDSYKMTVKDDVFYYVEAELKQYKSDDIDDSAIGGNKSAEGVDDDGDVDTETKTLINVVYDNRLVEHSFDNKKDYLSRHLKPFLAAVKKNKIAKGELPADDEAAQKEWSDKYQALVKKHVLDKFKDLQFFAGSSTGTTYDTTAHMAAVDYIDDKPVMIFFKDGLREVKA